MSIKVVLFDLDGTLLPMDQEVFVKAYFGALAKMLAPFGYESQKLVQTIWGGTVAMVKNDGTRTNEEAFWEAFLSVYGEQARNDMPKFDRFYEEDFDREVQPSCGFNPLSRPTVEAIKEMGLRVVLATNPIFPAVATKSRMKWAGLTPEMFELYTTFENSNHCKPSLEYYKDILNKLGVEAQDCLMVGNDVGEDMIAEELGMKVFLLTADLINKHSKDISMYPQGDLSDLLEYIKKIK